MAGLVGDLILKNRHFLDQFSDGLTADMVGKLKKAQESILDTLTKPKLDKLTKGHYRAVLAEVTSILREAHTGIESLALDGMSETAKLEYNSVANAIRSEAGLKRIARKAPNMGLPEKALKDIVSAPIGGYFLSDWVRKNWADHQFTVRSALTQGLIRGQGMEVIARNIRRATNMAMVPARTLARTTVMEASNKALREAYSDLDEYIEGYRWLGTLDSRTCMECAGMDGVFHKEYGQFRIVPLAHPNCRCVISPETRFEDGTLERPAKVWDADKKKFAYQRVSAKEAYPEWFARQDENFQRDYLGPARYRLYKDGKVKFKEFVDTRGNRAGPIINVKKLNEKYGEV